MQTKDITSLDAIELTLKEYSEFPSLQKRLASVTHSKIVNLLAIGKSAYHMAVAATRCLKGMGIAYSGYLLTKYGNIPADLPNIHCREAGHPVPDENSVLHSKEIVNWLQSLSPDDDLIILLSGGGSALFEIPAEGYSLQDVIELNRKLLHSGLSIADMNRERTKLSKLKSGKALGYVCSKSVYCYALSDVEGNDPAVIASGPFYLTGVEKPCITYEIIGDSLSFRRMLAERLGKVAHVHSGFMSDNADLAAERLADFAKSAAKGIHLFGGEAPVTVTGTGRGGRCTHLALAFALKISGYKGISLIAYATDGNDNLPGTAGAITDGETCAKLQEAGIDPRQSLLDCDSFTALGAINATILSTEYHINVNDLYILTIN